MRRFLLLWLLLSGPGLAAPDPLSKALVPRMERVLCQESGLRRVDFSLTLKGEVYVPPSFLERLTLCNLRWSGKTLVGKVLTSAQRQAVEEAFQEAYPGGGREIRVQVVAPLFGVIRVPLADLRVKPNGALGENLATQARLGEPLQILETSPDGRYRRVRLDDDGYLAWVESSQVQPLSPEHHQAWKSARQAILLVEEGGVLPATRLKVASRQGEVVTLELPGGQTRTVRASSVRMLTEGPGTLEQVMTAARAYLAKGSYASGAYLWGGRGGRNLDCSGFTQTVFALYGHYLPRDADQQQAYCLPVAATLKQLAELQPGDLVFFSSNREYATHVGLYLGNGDFIHDSSHAPNGVKISSLRGREDYDRELQRKYFGGGRLPKQADPPQTYAPNVAFRLLM